jgi:hypothetical protein
LQFVEVVVVETEVPAPALADIRTKAVIAIAQIVFMDLAPWVGRLVSYNDKRRRLGSRCQGQFRAG